MCGIVGQLNFSRNELVDPRALTKMGELLQHRGPDGGDVWVDQNVGFAHRRLSVIDLSRAANQPMCNEDGSVWITFNGEIYNFQELRAGLESQGHVFRTRSDTEVIIHAYEQYGRDCVGYLRGMFAFAIWDKRSDTLFLARDRVGKKPLYYFSDALVFLFASEIKALFADRRIPREPEAGAIDCFLALGYVPGPQTAFRKIWKLAPAHWLEVRRGKIETGRYWSLRYSPKRRISFADAKEELQWRFDEAVRIRLVSDVPLGAFLSGGVDSTAVVISMVKSMDRPVRTFSVGFGQSSFDELPYAREVARRYRTDHTELVVDAPVTDILSRLAWHYDEPFGDSSAVPSYLISQLTRQYVTVVLTGDGADETFGGYDWYKMDRWVNRTTVLPVALRKRFAAVMELVPDAWRTKRLLWPIYRLAQVMALAQARRYCQWTEHFSPRARRNMYTSDFSKKIKPNIPDELFDDLFSKSNAADWLDVILDTDVNLYLVDDLLVKMDRATMSHSLEGRSPFLDHVFMEFVASLPVSFKQGLGQKKRLLKALLRGRVSNELLDRPKMGFSVPLEKWFREDLREMAHDIILSKRSLERGYFQPEQVKQLVHNHHAAHNGGTKLWDLLMLELWHRAFIDPENIWNQ